MALGRTRASFLFMLSFWLAHGFLFNVDGGANATSYGYLNLTTYREAFDGEIEPSDAKYVTGETLWMNCTLSSSYTKPCNASHMYFLHNELALTDYQHVLDDRTLKLVIPNVNPVDHDEYYSCYMNETACGVGNSSQHLASNTASVGDPPPNVTDFTCVSQNFEDLTCTWSPCHNDNNYAATRWSLQWSFVNGSKYKMESNSNCEAYVCGGPRLKKAPCMDFNWLQYFQKYRHYNITLTGRNPYANRTSIHRVISNETIVKPDAPQWVKTEVVNATSILVRWTFPARLEPGVMPQVYWLKYTSQWGDENVNITSGKEPSHLLTNLRPYTLYKFEVRVKPESGGYLGDPASAQNTTHESVPGEAPSMAPGCFQTSSTPCVNKLPSCRTVHPFWQAIEEKQHNGVILGYRVNWTHVASGQQQTMQVDGGADVYSAGIDLDLPGDYVVSAQAYTQAGLGPASFLLIPDNGRNFEAIIEAEFMEKTDGIGFTFSPPEGVTKVDNYTLFGCANPNMDRYTCKESPWTIILRPESEHYVHVKSNSTKEAYAMAVATPGGTSGLGDWLCIYKYDGEAGQPKIRFSADQQQGSLRVEWDPLVCDAQNQGKVTHYVLYHQEYSGQGDLNATNPGVVVHNQTLAANVSTYLIDDLKPNTEYVVQLEAHTRAGPGPRGVASKKTLKPETWAAPLIVLVCVPVVALVIVAGWCIWRKCKRAERESVAKAIVEFPEEPNDDDHPDKTEQPLYAHLENGHVISGTTREHDGYSLPDDPMENHHNSRPMARPCPTAVPPAAAAAAAAVAETATAAAAATATATAAAAAETATAAAAATAGSAAEVGSEMSQGASNIDRYVKGEPPNSTWVHHDVAGESQHAPRSSDEVAQVPAEGTLNSNQTEPSAGLTSTDSVSYQLGKEEENGIDFAPVPDTVAEKDDKAVLNSGVSTSFGLMGGGQTSTVNEDEEDRSSSYSDAPMQTLLQEPTVSENGPRPIGPLPDVLPRTDGLAAIPHPTAVTPAPKTAAPATAYTAAEVGSGMSSSGGSSINTYVQVRPPDSTSVHDAAGKTLHAPLSASEAKHFPRHENESICADSSYCVCSASSADASEIDGPEGKPADHITKLDGLSHDLVANSACDTQPLTNVRPMQPLTNGHAGHHVPVRSLQDTSV